MWHIRLDFNEQAIRCTGGMVRRQSHQRLQGAATATMLSSPNTAAPTAVGQVGRRTHPGSSHSVTLPAHIDGSMRYRGRGNTLGRLLSDLYPRITGFATRPVLSIARARRGADLTWASVAWLDAYPGCGASGWRSASNTVFAHSPRLGAVAAVCPNAHRRVGITPGLVSFVLSRVPQGHVPLGRAVRRRRVTVVARPDPVNARRSSTLLV